MAAAPMISMAAAIAGLNALLAKLNVGGTAGSIKIYTGAAPASLAATETGTLLSSGCLLSTTAFPTAVDPGSNGLATATANAISTDASAAAGGTAGHFRAFDSTGVAVVQGTCGTSAADLIMATTTIVIAQPVTILSWIVTLPDGSGVD
jgi:hypothetical protein